MAETHSITLFHRPSILDLQSPPGMLSFNYTGAKQFSSQTLSPLYRLAKSLFSF